MITTDGRIHLKRYLAGFVPNIAESMALGLGGAAENVNDVKLQFEVDRTDIVLTSYDFVNNKLIFKAEVPEEFAGTIYEVAIYSSPTNANAGDFGSKILTTFDSATEAWEDATTATAATFVTTGMRIGADALRHTPAASGTKTDALKDISMDLSGYSGADKFVLAYNVGNVFTSSLSVKFHTDATNYYQLNIASPTAGYKVTEVAKSAAVATGTPDWANITEIRVTTNSTAGGASQVDFDGLRVDDADTINPDYVMVSRELLSTPFVKQEGMTQEVEFSLNIAIT